MRNLAILLCGLALCVMGSAVGLAKWAGYPGGALEVIGGLTRDALPFAALAVWMLVLAAPVILALGGWALLTRGRRGAWPPLLAFSLLPPVVGLLAATYSGLITLIVMARTHTTSLQVLAPSIAELLLALGVGLAVGALAAVPNAIVTARAAGGAAERIG